MSFQIRRCAVSFCHVGRRLFGCNEILDGSLEKPARGRILSISNGIDKIGQSHIEPTNGTRFVIAPNIKEKIVNCIPAILRPIFPAGIAKAWISRPATINNELMATIQLGASFTSATKMSNRKNGTYSGKFPWARIAASRQGDFLFLTEPDMSAFF
jgi:hypothetical protein